MNTQASPPPLRYSFQSGFIPDLSFLLPLRKSLLNHTMDLEPMNLSFNHIRQTF